MDFAYIFILGMIIGSITELTFAFLYELVTGRHFRVNHRFTLTKKLSVISIPIWGVIALVVNGNPSAILFLLAIIIGPLFEFLLGKGMHELFGIKIWTYKYGSIGEYTSVYTIPYWGGAALLFLTLARLLGI